MHIVLILINTLSVNTAYMFHFMHSLYSSIKCILKTNFSYVLCRWMIDQLMLVLDGDRGSFVSRGGGQPLHLALGDEVLRGGDLAVLPPREAHSSFPARL